MTNQELAEYDASVVATAAGMKFKEALRIIYDLAAENVIEDAETDELAAMQLQEHAALEKMWKFMLELE